MRYTPSANLGSIHLWGVNVTRKASVFDLYVSGNLSATRPNGQTTPFGGLMSDPFETPADHTGNMGYAGIRYNFANDERTKLGFEFNHGSKYWFNFAQASDDIIAPKTNTRGGIRQSDAPADARSAGQARIFCIGTAKRTEDHGAQCFPAPGHTQSRGPSRHAA